LLESLSKSTVIEKTEQITLERFREGAKLSPIKDDDILIIDRSPKGKQEPLKSLPGESF
jgi:hypothetical protein